MGARGGKGAGWRWRPWLTLAPALVVGTLGMGARAESRGQLVVAPIDGMIDLGLVPYVERVLADATRNEAAAVIFEKSWLG